LSGRGSQKKQKVELIQRNEASTAKAVLFSLSRQGEGGSVKASTSKKMFLTMVCGMLVCTGCTTAWISEAEQIVAALIPATANLLTLIATLEGKDISAGDLQTVQNAGTQAGADLQLLESLITQYQRAGAVAQPGLLNQIQVEMESVQSALNALLPALHIKDGATKTKVSAVIGIVIAEVESMAAIVPLADSSASAVKMQLTAKRQVPLTANQFVSSYNATMTARTGNAELDLAASRLRIHSHGKLERWASAGLLK
jgi:hypothetical protein